MQTYSLSMNMYYVIYTCAYVSADMCGMVQEPFSKLMARPLPGKSWKPMLLFWRDVWKKHLGQLRIPQPYLILPEHNINFLLNRDERRHLWTAKKNLNHSRHWNPAMPGTRSSKSWLPCSRNSAAADMTFLSETSNIPGKQDLLFLSLIIAPVFDGNYIHMGPYCICIWYTCMFNQFHSLYMV